MWKKLKIELKFNSAHHLQTDGKIKVVNRSLGNLLRCLVGDKPKEWDLILPQEKISYNNFVNRSTSRYLFQIMYRSSPTAASKLRKMEQGERTSADAEDFLEHVKNLREEVHAHVTKTNM